MENKHTKKYTSFAITGLYIKLNIINYILKQ